MLRPIDTQILYPQAPELSNRQQAANDSVINQQSQFAEIMYKETQIKKEKVQQAEKNEKVKNDKEKGNQSAYSNQKNKQNNKQNNQKQSDDILKDQKQNKCQIDIRI